MKLSALVPVIAVAMFGATPASAHKVAYAANLSGAAEAAPNTSPGSGHVRVTINEDTFMMRVQVTFQDLVTQTGAGAASGASASHIHCCTTVPGVATAGVATPLPSFPGFPIGTNVHAGSYDTTFDMSLASSWNASFISANGGTAGSAFSVLLGGLADGKAYLNIHSNAYGGGEIRGFLQAVPVPEPGTYALMLAGLGVLGWAGRQRPQT